MNQKQMEAAKEALAEWLAHPQELGKRPSKIECAGEFDLHDMHYYIFKYKKSALGKWLLGVCGGYEGEELTHCGHVFSEMQEYVEATAKDDAIKIVEMIRDYWIEQAEKAEKRKENSGTFVGFVLLKDALWDKNEFLKHLEDDWQIYDDGSKDDGDDKADDDKDEDIVIISYKGCMISAALMPAPVPDGEAEHYAENNYLWHNAVEITKKHQAHLTVAVMGKDMPAVESGEIFVKAIAACCKLKNVLGVYTCGTVFEPKYYLEFSNMMKDDMFPVYNLVWVGLYKSKNGFSGYTNGLASFGKDEIEVLDSSAEPYKIAEFMSDVAVYVICDDVTLRDGETIGFTEEQKLPITRSKGAAVDGESLKIKF